MFFYFMPPFVEFNWWAQYLPDLKWGYITPGVWLASVIIHKNKLSSHKLSTAYWVIGFYIYTLIITYALAVDLENAKIYSQMLFVYCIVMVLNIKTIFKFEQLRFIVFMIIVISANLFITTYGEGSFDSGRLNNVGPGDANGSNELGVLLVSILPFMIPFIIKGKMFERLICLMILPVLVNVITMTVSRGAVVALLFSVFYAFIVLGNRKIKKYILISIVCIVPAFVLLADDGYMKRISTLWNADTSSEAAMNDLSSGRTETWKDGYKMLQDHPLGTGPGGFRALSRFYMDENNLTYKYGMEYGVRAAHNSFLLVLVEQGYIGFIIFLIICVMTLYKLFKSYRTIKKLGMSGSFIDLFIISLNMSFVCTLFGGAFNSRVYYEFFWWQVALTVVASSIVAKEISTDVKGPLSPAI
ncbi:MAG: O-antigen ligase family protein [Candidatus Brocadiales bacterium]|nr:O-antigen ligase family protein [Candidatus Brocadiales bacterium]